MDNFFGRSPLDENKIKEINPLVLAFLGDAVHTAFVRDIIVRSHSFQVSKQHIFSSHFCKASFQSDVFERIFPSLCEGEKEICLRARNTKKNHKAKNSDTADYSRATAFEALVGYLFLKGDEKRLLEILSESIKENK